MATTSGDYSDFSQPSDFAEFQLIVEGKALFVNAHTLAQASPVFAKMCFGEGFKEKSEQKAVIAEETHEDILEMLQCVLSSFPKNFCHKPITDANLFLLIRLSDKFQISSLATACQRHIEDTYSAVLCGYWSRWQASNPNYTNKLKSMIDVLKVAVAYNLSETTVAQLIACTVFIGDETLAAADFSALPSTIIHRMMVAKMEETKKKHEKEMAETQWKHNREVADIKQERKEEVAQVKKQHKDNMSKIKQQHKEEMARAAAASATGAADTSLPVTRKNVRRQ